MDKLLKRTAMCGSFRSENIGETVTVNGWVAKKRNLGSLIFADIRDKSGIVQVVFGDDTPADIQHTFNSFNSHSPLARIMHRCNLFSLQEPYKSFLQLTLCRLTSNRNSYFSALSCEFFFCSARRVPNSMEE